MTSDEAELISTWPPEAKRIIVCGPRTWSQPFYVRCVLMNIRQRYGSVGVTIVNGLARGVDTFAYKIGEELGFTLEGHRANWQMHGKGAGVVRNYQMLDTGVDLTVAIGWGKGTQDMVDQSTDQGVPVVWRHRRVVPRAS